MFERSGDDQKIDFFFFLKVLLSLVFGITAPYVLRLHGHKKKRRKTGPD